MRPQRKRPRDQDALARDISAVEQRIESLTLGVRKAQGYLEHGTDPTWRGFRPLLQRKMRDGRELAPHPDWVRNVYLRRVERHLVLAERLLERLEARRR